MICMAAVLFGIWLGRRCGTRQHQRTSSETRQHQRTSSDKTTQTVAQRVRTYWQEPKDEVCQEGQRRGVPNASRLTRAELAGHLVEDDLGWARWK